MRIGGPVSTGAGVAIAPPSPSVACGASVRPGLERRGGAAIRCRATPGRPASRLHRRLRSRTAMTSRTRANPPAAPSAMSTCRSGARTLRVGPRRRPRRRLEGDRPRADGRTEACAAHLLGGDAVLREGLRAGVLGDLVHLAADVALRQTEPLLERERQRRGRILRGAPMALVGLAGARCPVLRQEIRADAVEPVRRLGRAPRWTSSSMTAVEAYTHSGSSGETRWLLGVAIGSARDLGVVVIRCVLRVRLLMAVPAHPRPTPSPPVVAVGSRDPQRGRCRTRGPWLSGGEPRPPASCRRCDSRARHEVAAAGECPRRCQGRHRARRRPPGGRTEWRRVGRPGDGLEARPVVPIGGGGPAGSVRSEGGGGPSAWVRRPSGASARAVGRRRALRRDAGRRRSCGGHGGTGAGGPFGGGGPRRPGGPRRRAGTGPSGSARVGSVTRGPQAARGDDRRSAQPHAGPGAASLDRAH